MYYYNSHAVLPLVLTTTWCVHGWGWGGVISVFVRNYGIMFWTLIMKFVLSLCNGMNVLMSYEGHCYCINRLNGELILSIATHTVWYYWFTITVCVKVSTKITDQVGVEVT